MSIRIEPAQPADAIGISEILSAWIDETDWMPRIHTFEEDREFGRWLIDIMTVRVARYEGKMAGFLARRGADVHSLYLAGVYRGRGIGTGLLDDAKAACDRLELWTFQANSGALRFYRRNGFVEDQRTDGAGNDEKLPDVHLTWVRDA